MWRGRGVHPMSNMRANAGATRARLAVHHADPVVMVIPNALPALLAVILDMLALWRFLCFRFFFGLVAEPFFAVAHICDSGISSYWYSGAEAWALEQFIIRT